MRRVEMERLSSEVER